MKSLFAAVSIYLLATMPAMADMSPEILGSIGAANVQPLDNAEEIRGEYFESISSDPEATLSAARSFCDSLDGKFNTCTGRYASITGYLGVQYKVYSFRGKRYRWKTY